MPPCHGGGRGFESRPVRKKTPNPLIIKGFFILDNIQDNLLPHATKVLSEATFPDTFRPRIDPRDWRPIPTQKTRPKPDLKLSSAPDVKNVPKVRLKNKRVIIFGVRMMLFTQNCTSLTLVYVRFNQFKQPPPEILQQPIKQQ